MKHLLGILTIIFCSGIFVASFINIPFWLIYSLAVLFFILSFLFLGHRESFFIFIFCLAFCIGACLIKNSQKLSSCHITKHIFYKSNSPYTIKGIITDEPRIKNKNTCFIFRSEEIQAGKLNRSCCGNILVYLKGGKNLQYGEELILKGNLHWPFSKSYRSYLRNKGIFFVMRVAGQANIVRLNKNKGFALKRLAFWLKQKIEGVISKYLSPIPASILEAMVLGEKRNIPAPVYNSMVKTGTVHILVVSGFNAGIVSFCVLLFLKLIRVSRKVRFCITIFFLIVYCFMTGSSNPVIRATIMTIVFILAYLIKREPDIYNSLSLAALFILVVSPRQLFDIGFQLSFVSVISIVYFYAKLKQLLHIEVIKNNFIKFILEGCLVSISAWLGTMGFIVYYFKIFSPITVIANLFIVPLAALITLCGFSLILIAVVFPAIAPFFASTAELAVAVLLKLNFFLVKLPFACFRLP